MVRPEPHPYNPMGKRKSFQEHNQVRLASFCDSEQDRTTRANSLIILNSLGFVLLFYELAPITDVVVVHPEVDVIPEDYETITVINAKVFSGSI